MDNDTLHSVAHGDDMMSVDATNNDNSAPTTDSGVTMDFSTGVRRHMSKIFLQTSMAQGIAGIFAFAAMMVTCWQVS